MNGSTSGFQPEITVTLLEGGWIQPHEQRMMYDANVDEETREYLREKALVERMTARRLFLAEDL
jgi:hypothetical protein